MVEKLNVTAVIRRNSGQVGWPTVLLCGGLVAGYSLVIAGWIAGAVPLWAGCMVNAVLSYAFYTVHHDANHKAISGRNERWLWLDTICGSIAAIPLQISFAGFSSAHLRHHAHTNDPMLDPDVLVAGPFWALPLKWLAGTVLGVVMALPWSDRLAARLMARLRPDAPKPTERVSQEMRRLRRYSRICLAVLVASIPLGWFLPVFFLWWLPGRLGVLALVVLFQWLPHFPHESTERFRNTRISSVGSYTHGFLTIAEAAQRDDVAAVLEAGWVDAAAVERLPHVRARPERIVYGPLAKLKSDPDVVLVRVVGAALMTLYDALPGLRIEGKPQCHIVAIAAEGGAPAVSVGCALSRARTGLASEEMTCALPARGLAEAVARIEVAARMDGAMARYASADAKRFGARTRAG